MDRELTKQEKFQKMIDALPQIETDEVTGLYKSKPNSIKRHKPIDEQVSPGENPVPVAIDLFTGSGGTA